MSLLKRVLDELINYSPYNDEVQTIATAHNTLVHRGLQIRGDFYSLSMGEQLCIGKVIAFVRRDYEVHGVYPRNLMKPLTATEIEAVHSLLPYWNDWNEGDA